MVLGCHARSHHYCYYNYPQADYSRSITCAIMGTDRMAACRRHPAHHQFAVSIHYRELQINLYWQYMYCMLTALPYCTLTEKFVDAKISLSAVYLLTYRLLYLVPCSQTYTRLFKGNVLILSMGRRRSDLYKPNHMHTLYQSHVYVHDNSHEVLTECYPLPLQPDHIVERGCHAALASSCFGWAF